MQLKQFIYPCASVKERGTDNKIDAKDLAEYGFNKEEAKELKQVIEEVVEANEVEKKEIANKIQEALHLTDAERALLPFSLLLLSVGVGLRYSAGAQAKGLKNRSNPSPYVAASLRIFRLRPTDIILLPQYQFEGLTGLLFSCGKEG